MANRILLGDIGSTFGLKVSRAGTDVTTGADKDMLFDSTKNRTYFLLLYSTKATLPGKK